MNGTQPQPAIPFTDAEVLDLARIGWERENEVSDVPAGFGYDWNQLDSTMHARLAVGVRAVLGELARRGQLYPGPWVTATDNDGPRAIDSWWRCFLLPGGAGACWGRTTPRKYFWLVVERIQLRHSERRYEHGARQLPARASRHLLNFVVDTALIASRIHWVLPPVRAKYPFTPRPWSRCHCGDLADILDRVHTGGNWCSPCAFSGHPSCECSAPQDMK